MKKLEFTPPERQVIEEAFLPFLQVMTVVAKLKGITGPDLARVQLAPDRSGFMLPDEESQ